MVGRGVASAVPWAWIISLAAVFSTLVLFARPAEAQDKTFYLDRLQIAGAPDDAIALWRPQMSEKTRFYGQFALGFAMNPLRVENHLDTIQSFEQTAASGM